MLQRTIKKVARCAIVVKMVAEIIIKLIKMVILTIIVRMAAKKGR